MDKGKISVNILIHGLVGGGAERVVSEIIQNPPKDINLSLSLFSLNRAVYSSGDVSVFVYDEHSSYNCLTKILFTIRPRILYSTYLHYLYMRENRVDVSVSFLKDANILNMLVSKIFHIPAVISIRNNLSKESGIIVKIYTILQKYLIKLCSPYLIVNSEDNKKWLITNYHLQEDRCICIYNPKDIAGIREQSLVPLDEDFFKTNELILLSVGRLVPQKGHIHLLRVFYHLKKICPCRLVICGVGPLDGYLKEITKSLGISDSVYFAGFCKNPYQYMKQADIFVLSSLYEGQPNALIEALICGCAIVSTNCDYGPKEILDNGNYGLLSQKLESQFDNPMTTPLNRSEIDLYEKILYLMKHPGVRESLSQKSYEYVEKYNKEIIVNEYFDMFKKAVLDE